jgi:hypothetical protein
MPAHDFKTVADELLHVAADAEDHFRNQGFDVKLEAKEVGFPFTPTLVCRRGHETMIVEVSSVLDTKRTERWCRYCKSQMADTRFCAVLRTQAAVDQQTIRFFTENRIGVYIHDDYSLTVFRSAVDLAVQVDLPEVGDLAKPLRPLLAPAFHKIREGDWRDGLNHAYSEVEQRARDYLKEGIDSGRVIISRRRNRQMVVLSSMDVDAMTLGQLKDAFALIQNQTSKDAIIGSILATINKTRVGLAHKRGNKVVEAELRLQVGPHMYAVITCLEELTS